MNNKGFVLLETLVVTIFTLITFTILYNTIVPLLGRYTEISYYDDLDATYDLYHLKKYIQTDSNFSTLTANNYQKIRCNNLENETYCNNLFNHLNITSDDEIVYLNTTYQEELLNDTSIALDLKNYLKYKKIETNKKIILIQKNGFTSYIEII